MAIRRISTNLRDQIAPPVINDRYQWRYGSALTPMVASSVLRSADLGYMHRLADLNDEILEGDGHLQAVFGKRCAHIATVPWELRYPEDEDQPTSSRKRKKDIIIDACKDALRRMGLPLLLNDLQSSVYQGAAVVEIIYNRDGRYMMPESFELIHARRYRYSQLDWQMRLYDFDMASPFGVGEGFPVKELQKLLPGKFIYDRARIRPGYPQRDGLGRTSLWFAGVFKKMTIRDLMALIEQYGRPIRYGTYSTGQEGEKAASPEDVDELEAALLALNSSLVASFPDTTKPNFYDPPAATGELQDKMRSMCDAENSKLYLGNTLTTEVGSTGGNRALGGTQREDQLMVTSLDAFKRCHAIRRDFLVPFVRMNFGDKAEAPHLFLLTSPKDDLNALATRYKTLADIIPIDEGQIRDEFGLRDITPGSPSTTPPGQSMQDPDGDAEQDDDPGDLGESEESEEPNESIKPSKPSKPSNSGGKPNENKNKTNNADRRAGKR